MEAQKATVLRLSPSTKLLLTKMNFPPIPEEANYIAFTEDGEAQFFEEFDSVGPILFPQVAIVDYYEIPQFVAK